MIIDHSIEYNYNTKKIVVVMNETSNTTCRNIYIYMYVLTFHCVVIV